MNKFCVYQDYTIKETIDRIDASKNRVAIVVNKTEKVIGVVSQGDIIRALGAGKSVYSRVDGIIQSSFLYLNERDMEQAYPIFRKKTITLLPIVDNEFYLIDVITIIDIYNYLEEKCDI